MKHRISGRFAPNTLSTAMIAGALCFASGFASTAQANTTALTCSGLTPAEIAKVAVALDAAQASANATTASAGYDPESPSAYPNAQIRFASMLWKTELDYLATMPATYVVPYLTPGNVALSLEQASIDMAYRLQHGRFWATWGGYNYALTDPTLAEKYIETRKAIAAAIDAVQRVSNLGSRCAMGQVSVSPNLPNP